MILLLYDAADNSRVFFLLIFFMLFSVVLACREQREPGITARSKEAEPVVNHAAAAEKAAAQTRWMYFEKKNIFEKK